MSEFVAWLNGELVPFREAKLPVYDTAIVQGATVTERLRTVRQQPVWLTEHLARLEQSLDLVGWDDVPTSVELERAVQQVLAYNTRHLKPMQELGVVLFVSAGPFLPDACGLAQLPVRPTVCVHTSLLPTAQWEPLYAGGVHLYTPEIRQVPATCVDPRIKQRSRLHWHMADRQVRRLDPQGVALLLDQQGYLTETSSANLFVGTAERLYTPAANTLPGITQAKVVELARQLGIEVQRTNLTLDDLLEADEAFLTSSTFLLMPATQCNARALGTGLPGELTKRLQTTLWESVGLESSRAG